MSCILNGPEKINSPNTKHRVTILIESTSSTWCEEEYFFFFTKLRDLERSSANLTLKKFSEMSNLC